MKRLSCLFLAATMALTLAACGGGSAETPAPENTTPAETTPAETAGAVISGVEDGVLTVGMECAYAPYNWTQMDDSNGAVPIVNNPGSYANGYDVMMAQKVCDTYGWELEVMALEWAASPPPWPPGPSTWPSPASP